MKIIKIILVIVIVSLVVGCADNQVVRNPKFEYTIYRANGTTTKVRGDWIDSRAPYFNIGYREMYTYKALTREVVRVDIQALSEEN